MKNILNTKYGVFETSDNGNGGTAIFMGNAKICEFPKVAWWNVDALEAAIEQHHDVIEKRIAERVDDVKVTRENAADVLTHLIDVLGNENKGFYSSRLKQCLNKLTA